MKKYKIGDVVMNKTSNCVFVVEQNDLSWVNNPVSGKNYENMKRSFGICDHPLIDQFVIVQKKGFWGLFFKKFGRVMRNPYNGNVLVYMGPLPCSCSRGIPLDSFRSITKRG